MNAYRRSPAHEITVSAEHAERRLDKFLRSRLKGVPAGLVFRLLRKGAVRVDGRRAKPDHRLQAGEIISVPAMDLPPPTDVRVPEPVKNYYFHHDYLAQLSGKKPLPPDELRPLLQG